MLQKKNWLDKMLDQGCNLIGHQQILVGHCTMTKCYLQPWSERWRELIQLLKHTSYRYNSYCHGTAQKRKGGRFIEPVTVTVILINIIIVIITLLYLLPYNYWYLF